jgi:hypothetical protein
MKKSFLLGLVLFLVFGLNVFAQNKYEVEILMNPNRGSKDTREVNSVIIFEADKVVVKSRRKNEIFKEIKYSDLKSAEHTYSKRPWLSEAIGSAALTIATGFPLHFGRDEKNWLTVIGESDFFVLKLENDNYRQIKAEFEIRKVKVETINSDKSSKKSSSKKDAQKEKPEENSTEKKPTN